MSETVTENLSLVQKLAKIRAISDVVKKNKKGYNYTYADVTQILANVTAGMKKYKVSLIPSIVPGTASISQNVISNTKITKTGDAYESKSTEMIFSAEMNYRWINDDNPSEFIDVPWFTTGSMSDPSQAMASAQTYNLRVFLTSFFQIAQSDNDVDAYRSKQKEAEEVENKAVVAELVSEIDKIVKNIVQSNPEKRDEMIEFISKYAKNANYNAIKDLTTATNLINGLKEKYIKEGE